jgi:hypothetical protein
MADQFASCRRALSALDARRPELAATLGEQAPPIDPVPEKRRLPIAKDRFQATALARAAVQGED